ncbi:MAG: DUF6152 family protein [Gammaproteobacteria bacterium]
MSIVLAAALAALSWSAAPAHHAFGTFDLSSPRTVAGSVVEFDWTNPHVVTRIAVPGPNGSQVIWQFEGMSPGYLGRRGWNRETLTEGSIVELDYYPLKTGEPGGLLIRARLSDGTVKVMINEPDDRIATSVGRTERSD